MVLLEVGVDVGVRVGVSVGVIVDGSFEGPQSDIGTTLSFKENVSFCGNV